MVKENQVSTFSSKDNSRPSAGTSTPSTPSSTDKFTARSSDTYIYDVGIVAVLAICAFVFLHITRNLLKPRMRNKPTNINVYIYSQQ